MKTQSIHTIKKELHHHSKEELIQLVLRLGKYKVENKELLSYLLFEAADEDGYIAYIKTNMDLQFEVINRESYYYIKKSVRKILRLTKRFIKYSKKLETETSLLIHFCENLKKMEPSYLNNQVLMNMFSRQISLIEKNIDKMHEDLRYDFEKEISTLK